MQLNPIGRRHAIRLSIVAATAAAVIGIAGCGGSSPGSSSSGGAEAEPAGNIKATADASLEKMVPANIKQAGTLTLATDATYPPCEWVPSGSSEMVGFEPDLWNALGEKLGVKVDASSINFDGLIPGVQSHRFDTAMECISDTEEREKQVTFVDFMYAELALVALESNSGITEDPLSLCGKSAATQSGTVYGELVTEVLSPYCTKHGKESIQLLEFPAETQVLLAVYSGRADFSVNDVAAATYLKKNAPQPVKILTNKLMPKQYIGAVVNKSEPELAKALLAGFESLQADGTYQKILKKWKLPQLALEPPGINLATARPIPTPAA
ncbi:MAG: ABC transporter substrate-binding protein [Actinobacteria bacterium]|nr:ABC transporter substrate-binding protein [Actinomycetota bacterium]